jgi:hypothetical protein
MTQGRGIIGSNGLLGKQERLMRDFKHEIDQTNDPNMLRELLADLNAAIEDLAASPYEEAALDERIHHLELLFRYGEHKLEKLLA